MEKAHKIRLNPTSEQEQYFWRAAGIARYAFNWGLAEWNFLSDYKWQAKKAGTEAEFPISGRLLKKEFNRIKPSWVSEVTCWAYQGAFDDLQAAFRNFFEKRKKGLLTPPKDWKPRKDKRPFGYPRFKSKFRSTPAFYLANTVLNLDNHWIQFDKKRVGWVNMAEPLRFTGKVLGGRVSYQKGYWWLSVQV
jgi:putative transposase